MVLTDGVYADGNAFPYYFGVRLRRSDQRPATSDRVPDITIAVAKRVC
jgi:hypothetical protein